MTDKTKTDNIDQAEIDRLMTEMASSGVKIAAVTDSRYKMNLRRRAGAVWLVITGLVMQPIPHEFTDRLKALCDEEKADRAIVDLRECVYLSSSALGVLSLLLHRGGSKVLLLGPSDKIMKMISLVGLGELVHKVDNEAEAIRWWVAEQRRRESDPGVPT
ncbi:MAG: STAS domain-containing protein [Planctomycetota bacterium]